MGRRMLGHIVVLERSKVVNNLQFIKQEKMVKIRKFTAFAQPLLPTQPKMTNIVTLNSSYKPASPQAPAHSTT